MLQSWSMKTILNWKTAGCFFIVWMITNGWAYVLLGIGVLFQLKFLIAIATAYLSFLWLPFTPEKIITIAIACKLRKALKV